MKKLFSLFLVFMLPALCVAGEMPYFDDLETLNEFDFHQNAINVVKL